MTVGGVDTYYDYDERQWKSRRLGGGPIRRGPICPSPRSADHYPAERGPLSRKHPEARDSQDPPPDSALD